MEIVTSNKGGAKISYQGFLYTKKATKKTRIRWECSQRKGLSCKGAITTDLNNEDIQLTHMPWKSSNYVGKYELNTSSQLHLEVVQRRGALPKDPAYLREIEIPHEWRTTGGPDPQPFLMHDSGSDSGPQRMIIFATDRTLRHLARADEWFMDGNFSMAPDHFCQLYVIRAPVGDTCISCVYALLPNKTQETYEQMLQAILDRCDELQLMPDPSQVIVDYEKAVIQALHSKLGEHVEVKGCFFHLTQIDDVPTGMEYLCDNTPDGAEELLEYFEATYVRGTFRQVQLPAANDDAPAPVRVRRRPPLFPPGLWNVHKATMRDGNRCPWRAAKKTCEVSSKDLQTRLKAICTQHRDGVKTLEEALRALGPCIRF
ncbi:hypothetical protein ACOMHN_011937 [Nucella lapillus]